MFGGERIEFNISRGLLWGIMNGVSKGVSIPFGRERGKAPIAKCPID